jgi:hypothetical protein
VTRIRELGLIAVNRKKMLSDAAGIMQGYVTYGSRDALFHVSFYFLICCHYVLRSVYGQ